MSQQSYEAILHGDRLEWRGQRPPIASEPVTVTVTVTVPVTPLQPDPPEVAPPKGEPNGKAIAALFEELARRGTLESAIPDPAAWQREIRRDRPLPGRE